MTDVSLTNLLLRRGHTAFLPLPEGAAAEKAERAELIGKLETELAQFGYLVGADLRTLLVESGYGRMQLTEISRQLLATLAEARGANAYHVAQFRQFPRSTPHDTVALYIERVLHWLLQAPDAPCLFCGSADTVQPVRPCGHLVCSNCFDGSDHSGCPICHQRVDPDDPFIKPAPEREPLPVEHTGPFILLRAGTDAGAAARAIAQKLLGRQSALSPADRDDLLVLVNHLGVELVELAPKGGIPVKETQALVYGTLLSRSVDPADTFTRFAPQLGTATDLLRVLNVWMGGDAGLVEQRPRLKGMSRPLRRAVLARLESLPLERAGEDTARHRERWIRVGEALRPFEYHKQFPQTALVFAALRRTAPEAGTPLDDTIVQTAATAVVTGEGDSLVVTTTRVKLRSFAAQVEQAIEKNDLERALKLLSTRPGELARRYDQLLRLSVAAGDEDAQRQVVDMLAAACEKLPTPLLLTLRGQISKRAEPLNRRVFFPRGAVSRPYSLADQRSPLPVSVVEQTVTILSGELSRRAGKLAPVGTALIDEALSDLLVPVAERTASKSLVALPRGSRIPLPSGDEKLRLFLHWMEKGSQRIDLDLSVAFFNADWRVVAECDYTQLRGFAEQPEAAVHSGDLTSAPAPLGASEFVDLDIDKLRSLGIRHAAMIVFSYNDVPFDQMDEAFAGFMRGRDQRGEIFDARTVEQRFDLTGNSKVCIPLLIDIERAVMTWIDVQPSAADGFHAIWRHKGKLAHMCCDLNDIFSSGTRPTLFEVAAIHAGARAQTVHVRGRDGQVNVFVRKDGEDAAAFTRRLLTFENAAEQLSQVNLDGAPVFAALTAGDVELPANSSAYILRPQLTPDPSVTLLAASDLVSALER